MEVSRNLEQVNSILNLAKLSESDVKKESHVLHFIPQIIDQKQVKLLEVSKETLEYLKSGERFALITRYFLIFFMPLLCTNFVSYDFSLYIKGDKNSHVVMCSNNATFDLKEAETSNSLLLMPSIHDSQVVEETEGRVLKMQEVIKTLVSPKSKP